MVEPPSGPLQRPLPDGTVPERVVVQTEERWLTIMVAMLVTMIVIMVLTSFIGALHPASNVEVIDSRTLHLKGEFVESNLGTALEPDGSATVRLIALQYDFVPRCLVVPAQVPVRFRLTSDDVIHGFLLPNTNINTMVVPGFVAEVRTRFSRTGDYLMPCHEYCGLGHQAMWARVRVVPWDQFAHQGLLERTSCAAQ